MNGPICFSNSNRACYSKSQRLEQRLGLSLALSFHSNRHLPEQWFDQKGNATGLLNGLMLAHSSCDI